MMQRWQQRNITEKYEIIMISIMITIEGQYWKKKGKRTGQTQTYAECKHVQI